MEKITAPFTEEQVKNLNEYQKAGRFHPYTCCSQNLASCKRKKSTKERNQKADEYLSNGIEWLKKEIKDINYPLDADELCDWQMANIIASKDIPYTDENEGVLIATIEGWICPCGEYTQNSASSYMAEPQNISNIRI